MLELVKYFPSNIFTNHSSSAILLKEHFFQYFCCHKFILHLCFAHFQERDAVFCILDFVLGSKQKIEIILPKSQYS